MYSLEDFFLKSWTYFVWNIKHFPSNKKEKFSTLIFVKITNYLRNMFNNVNILKVIFSKWNRINYVESITLIKLICKMFAMIMFQCLWWRKTGFGSLERKREKTIHLFFRQCGSAKTFVWIFRFWKHVRCKLQVNKLLFYSNYSIILLFYSQLFDGHFDTTVGLKVEPSSYENIARTIGCSPSDVLFLTDVVKGLFFLFILLSIII